MKARLQVAGLVALLGYMEDHTAGAAPVARQQEVIHPVGSPLTPYVRLPPAEHPPLFVNKAPFQEEAPFVVYTDIEHNVFHGPEGCVAPADLRGVQASIAKKHGTKEPTDPFLEKPLGRHTPTDHMAWAGPDCWSHKKPSWELTDKVNDTPPELAAMLANATEATRVANEIAVFGAATDAKRKKRSLADELPSTSILRRSEGGESDNVKRHSPHLLDHPRSSELSHQDAPAESNVQKRGMPPLSGYGMWRPEDVAQYTRRHDDDDDDKDKDKHHHHGHHHHNDDDDVPSEEHDGHHADDDAEYPNGHRLHEHHDHHDDADDKPSKDHDGHHADDDKAKRMVPPYFTRPRVWHPRKKGDPYVHHHHDEEDKDEHHHHHHHHHDDADDKPSEDHHDGHHADDDAVDRRRHAPDVHPNGPYYLEDLPQTIKDYLSSGGHGANTKHVLDDQAGFHIEDLSPEDRKFVQERRAHYHRHHGHDDDDDKKEEHHHHHHHHDADDKPEEEHDGHHADDDAEKKQQQHHHRRHHDGSLDKPADILDGHHADHEAVKEKNLPESRSMANRKDKYDSRRSVAHDIDQYDNRETPRGKSLYDNRRSVAHDIDQYDNRETPRGKALYDNRRSTPPGDDIHATELTAAQVEEIAAARGGKGPVDIASHHPDAGDGHAVLKRSAESLRDSAEHNTADLRDDNRLFMPLTVERLAEMGELDSIVPRSHIFPDDLEDERVEKGWYPLTVERLAHQGQLDSLVTKRSPDHDDEDKNRMGWRPLTAERLAEMERLKKNKGDRNSDDDDDDSDHAHAKRYYQPWLPQDNWGPSESRSSWLEAYDPMETINHDVEAPKMYNLHGSLAKRSAASPSSPSSPPPKSRKPLRTTEGVVKPADGRDIYWQKSPRPANHQEVEVYPRSSAEGAVKPADGRDIFWQKSPRPANHQEVEVFPRTSVENAPDDDVREIMWQDSPRPKDRPTPPDGRDQLWQKSPRPAEQPKPDILPRTSVENAPDDDVREIMWQDSPRPKDRPTPPDGRQQFWQKSPPRSADHQEVEIMPRAESTAEIWPIPILPRTESTVEIWPIEILPRTTEGKIWPGAIKEETVSNLPAWVDEDPNGDGEPPATAADKKKEPTFEPIAVTAERMKDASDLDKDAWMAKLLREDDESEESDRPASQTDEAEPGSKGKGDLNLDKDAWLAEHSNSGNKDSPLVARETPEVVPYDVLPDKDELWKDTKLSKEDWFAKYKNVGEKKTPVVERATPQVEPYDSFPSMDEMRADTDLPEEAWFAEYQNLAGKKKQAVVERDTPEAVPAFPSKEEMKADVEKPAPKVPRADEEPMEKPPTVAPDDTPEAWMKAYDPDSQRGKKTEKTPDNSPHAWMEKFNPKSTGSWETRPRRPGNDDDDATATDGGKKTAQRRDDAMHGPAPAGVVAAAAAAADGPEVYGPEVHGPAGFDFPTVPPPHRNHDADLQMTSTPPAATATKTTDGSTAARRRVARYWPEDNFNYDWLMPTMPENSRDYQIYGWPQHKYGW